MINELDVTYMELQTITDEIVNGCMAYHNACVVVNYYNKYGYTEHFRELIGEESLVDQAKEVIGKFISWLKKKLTELIEKITNTFHAIRDRLVKLLGLKKTSNDLKDVMKQIDINLTRIATYRRGDDTVSINFDTSRIKTVTELAVDFIHRGSSSNAPSDYTAKSIKHLKSVFDACQPLSHYENVKRRTVRDNALDVSARVGNLSAIVETFQIELKELKLTISEDMTRDEFLQAIGQFTKCSPESFNKRLFDQNIDVVVKELTLIVSTMAKATCKLINITYGYLVQLNRDVNKDVPIRVVVKINPLLLQRLERQFGGSLNVRNIVITNEDPQTWELADAVPDERPTCGWCYAGHDRTGSLDLYINYRLYKKYFKDHNYNDFILTIVHECQHLYNSQHNMQFDNNEETTARNAEKKYTVAQPDDIAWAKEVVKKIKEQENA